MANDATHRDLFNMMTEEKLGHGQDRQVYTSKVWPDKVIKVEENATGRFQNIIEWETWRRIKDTKFAKWFAPCHWISPNGIVLVMDRTEEPQKSQYPEMMPVFLSDFKYSNYGMLNGQLVCHDYGVHLLFERGMVARMRPANWWSERNG